MKKMKKALASLLAATMVMSMSVTAWADEADKNYTDMSTVTLTKEYKLANTGTTSPAEIFKFSALTCTDVKNAGVGVTKENAPVPTIANVEYKVGDAGGANAKKDITITLPQYDAVGVYTYTFTEVDGGTAGVSYREASIKLVVTVIEQSGKVRVAAIHTESENGTKSNLFDNTYSAGSLAVTKKVTGQFGDKKKSFNVTVTFTAPDGDVVRGTIKYSDNGVQYEIGVEDWTTDANGKVVATKKIDLKDDETVTFTNIPYGVTYTVVEDDYTGTGEGNGYDTAQYDYTDNGGEEKNKIDSAEEKATITNNKGGAVETGILLDSAPYVLLLALAGVGAFAVATKKREEEF